MNSNWFKDLFIDEAKSALDANNCATEYCDSKGGYTEPGVVLSFDGKLDGKDTFEGYVKVSSELIDLNAVEEFVAVNADSATVYSKAENPELFEIFEDEGIVILGEAIVTVPVDFTQANGNVVTKGTYVLSGDVYISKVVLAETIVPIDPKYLPEGGVGYERPEKKVVVPETKYIFTDGTHTVNGGGVLTDGATYHVTWDDKKYVCKAFSMEEDGTPGVLIGNGKILELNDTGEPFIIIYTGGSLMIGDCAGFETGGETTHTVGLYSITETIVPIDPKYLPEGGVGYTKNTNIYRLPETVITAETYTTAFGINGCFLLPMFTLEEGKNYKVVVDGLTMEHLASEYAEQFIGNNYIYNGVEHINNGEPWLVVSAPSMGVCAVAFADPAENEKSHTVAIYEVVETIVPIDPKFLPEGGFGYHDGEDYEVVVDPNKDYSDAPTLFNDPKITKVSDLTPSIEEILTGTITGIDLRTGAYSSEIIPITSDMIGSLEGTIFSFVGDGYHIFNCIVIYTSIDKGSQDVETGIYVSTGLLEEYLTAPVTMKWHTGTKLKIDQKYLPTEALSAATIDTLKANGQIGKDKSYDFQWDGIFEGKEMVSLTDQVGFYKVSDKVLSEEELLGATFVGINGTQVLTVETFKDLSSNTGVQSFCVVDPSKEIAVFSGKACTVPFNGATFEIPSDGTYFCEVTNPAFTGGTPFVSSLSNEIIHKIDQKYLPGPKKINLADYGIDMATIVLSGTKIVDVNDTGALWDEINKGGDIVYIVDMGSRFAITPTTVSYYDDTKTVSKIGANVTSISVDGNSLMTIYMCIQCMRNGETLEPFGTRVNCVVTNIPLT